MTIRLSEQLVLLLILCLVPCEISISQPQAVPSPSSPSSSHCFASHVIKGLELGEKKELWGNCPSVQATSSGMTWSRTRRQGSGEPGDLVSREAENHCSEARGLEKAYHWFSLNPAHTIHPPFLLYSINVVFARFFSRRGLCFS